MSKYDVGQLNFAALCIDGKKIAADHGGLVAELDGTVVADMLREYAAHLAAQAEWPSEEDALNVCIAYYGVPAWKFISEKKGCVANMRAALQSVRPPVGVVSDDYKEIARLIGSIFFFGDFKAETHNERELEKLLRKTGNFYDTQEQFDDASRHAPTKD